MDKQLEKPLKPMDGKNERLVRRSQQQKGIGNRLKLFTFDRKALEDPNKI